MAKSTQVSVSAVRAFAAANGEATGKRGRVSKDLIARFEAANPGQTYSPEATRAAKVKTVTVKVPHRTPSGKSAPKRVTMSLAEARKVTNSGKRGVFGAAGREALVAHLSK